MECRFTNSHALPGSSIAMTAASVTTERRQGEAELSSAGSTTSRLGLFEQGGVSSGAVIPCLEMAQQSKIKLPGLLHRAEKGWSWGPPKQDWQYLHYLGCYKYGPAEPESL